MTTESPRPATGVDRLATLSFLIWALIVIGILLIVGSAVITFGFEANPSTTALNMGGIAALLGSTIVNTIRLTLLDYRNQLTALEQELMRLREAIKT